MTAHATIEQTESGPVLTVPKLDVAELGLSAGSSLIVSFVGENVVLRPVPPPRYTLEDLLAQCDFSLPMSDEDREWLNSPPVGRELI